MSYQPIGVPVAYDNVSTVTGYTTSPATTGRYTLNGKFCTVQISINGAAPTSNATTKTATLPFPAANTNTQYGVVRAVDNSITSTIGVCVTRVNSNIIDIYPTAAQGNWTASGTGRFTLWITYQIV